MAEKTVPWWRKALNYALDGIRSGFGLFSRSAKPQPAMESELIAVPQENLEEEETVLTYQSANMEPIAVEPKKLAEPETAPASTVVDEAVVEPAPLPEPDRPPETFAAPDLAAEPVVGPGAETNPEPELEPAPAGEAERALAPQLEPEPESEPVLTTDRQAVVQELSVESPTDEQIDEPASDNPEVEEEFVEETEAILIPEPEQAKIGDTAATVSEGEALAAPPEMLVSVPEQTTEENITEGAIIDLPASVPHQIAEEPGLVTGHDSSRAATQTKHTGALAPEAGFSHALPESHGSSVAPQAPIDSADLDTGAVSVADASPITAIKPIPERISAPDTELKVEPVTPIDETAIVPESAQKLDPPSEPEPALEPVTAAEVEPSEPAIHAPTEPAAEPGAVAESAATADPKPAPLPLSEPEAEIHAFVAQPPVEEADAAEPEPVPEPAPPVAKAEATSQEPAVLPEPEPVPEPIPPPAPTMPIAAAAELPAPATAEPAPEPAHKPFIKLETRDNAENLSHFSVIVDQVYDGPLDLLLDLIRKQDIDIYDIPIAKITAQFLAYVNQLKAGDVDVAGEFIYIASLLIHIKSKMLLPRAPSGPEEADEDPRRELVDRLLEHERFKNAAQMLQQKQMLEAATWTNPGAREFKDDAAAEPEIAADTVDLVRIFRDILERARSRPTIDLTEDSVTVGQMIQFLARRLTMEDKPVALRRLLSHTRSERALIAMFLALLELVRLQAILLRQDRAFSEIFIKKHTGFDAVMNEGFANAHDDWQ